MISFGWKHHAGLVCLLIGRFAVHVGVKRRHWVWGYKAEEYDHVLDYYGFGPVFLVAVLN